MSLSLAVTLHHIPFLKKNKAEQCASSRSESCFFAPLSVHKGIAGLGFLARLPCNWGGVQYSVKPVLAQ